MIFTKQTIKFRIVLILALFTTGSLFDVFIFSLISSKIKTEESKIQVVERNKLEIQKTAYSAQSIISQNEKSGDEIEYSVNLIDLSISSLINGGMPPNLENAVIFDKARNEIIPDLETNRKIWEQFKEQYKIIETEPLLNSVKTPFDTIINATTVERFKTKIIPNPAISESSEKISTLLKDFINSSDNLILTYKESKSTLEFYKTLFYILFIFFSLFVLISIIWILQKNILTNIKAVKQAAEKILSGENKNENFEYPYNDEIKPLFNAVGNLNQKITDIAQYVQKLENEDFNARIENYNKENKLDNALVALRRNLKRRKNEEQKQYAEEKIRQWSLEGQTKFNEILRSTSTDFNELADQIIKNIVVFLNAAQGGLFIYNDTDPNEHFLELKSAFAYDRKKFLTKKIYPGEGLIGMCAVERNLIYLTNIPSDYMEIESGLGEAIPKCLLILPLKTENELLGIIEIASFFELQSHEVEFIENIGQNITSTLDNSRIGTRTSELLKESQKKSEELALRDAEMQKSIREMRAAQEEAHQKEAEMSGILSAVDQTLLKAEFFTDGSIISANRIYISKLEYHFEELKHKKIFDFFPEEYLEQFRETWDETVKDQPIRVTHKQISKNKNTLWLLSQYSPIKNEKGNVIRILYLGNDITHQKEIEERNQKLLNETLEKATLLAQQEKELKQNTDNLINAQKENQQKEIEINALHTSIDNTLIKVEFNTRGTIILSNKKFHSTFNYNLSELSNKNVRDFIPKEDLPTFEQQWSNLHLGVSFPGTFRMLNKEKKEIWLQASYTPVEDNDGIIIKIVFLASDITDLINKQKSIDSQTEQINRATEILKENLKKTTEELDKLVKTNENQKNFESSVLKKFESSADKKYYNWIQSLKKD